MAPPDRNPESVDGTVLAREGRYVAVAESAANGDRVVGVGGVHLADGRLLGVFVHPDRVGDGIGRALFEDIEERARAAGLDTLTIHSALNAVGFYESVGFEQVEAAHGSAGSGVGGPLGPYDTETANIRARVLRKEL